MICSISAFLPITSNGPKSQSSGQVKHRLWHTFWEGIFLKQEEVDGEKKISPVGQRLLELKEITRNYGYKQIKAHMAEANVPEVHELRQRILQDWEGVDIYWDQANKTLDGNLDSSTCFGKFWADAYPFHGFVVYDDSDDATSTVLTLGWVSSCGKAGIHTVSMGSA